MDLAAHFRVIAQNWLRILLISVGIAVLVFAASTVQSKEYQAKTQLEVVPGNAATNGQTLADTSTYLAQNYAQYAKTPTVVRNAIKTSGMKLTVEQATSRISASQVGDLGFVEVKATGPNRADAERLTRFAASSLVSTIQAQQTEAKFADLLPVQTARNQAQTQLDALAPGDPDRAALQGQIDAYNQSEIDIRSRKDDNLVTISGAIAGNSPISPMPLRDAILAFVVALVVVAELTVLVHYTGDRFSRTEDTADVTRITGLPVLAKIPKGSGIELTEAFRVLRTNLMVLEGAGKPRTLAVVSSNQSAGKTFTAVHLAQSAAGLDEKVVIVDADLRKPSVHERLGVPRAPGSPRSCRATTSPRCCASSRTRRSCACSRVARRSRTPRRCSVPARSGTSSTRSGPSASSSWTRRPPRCSPTPWPSPPSATRRSSCSTSRRAGAARCARRSRRSSTPAPTSSASW